MKIADFVALASLVASMAALFIALYAVWRGNRNTSASTLITLNEAFRQGWDRLIEARDSAHVDQLAHIMNLLETSCAIYLERSLAGVSRELVGAYLDSVLTLLVKESVFSKEIPDLLNEEHTFEHIKRYLNKRRRSLTIIPANWYES